MLPLIVLPLKVPFFFAILQLLVSKEALLGQRTSVHLVSENPKGDGRKGTEDNEKVDKRHDILRHLRQGRNLPEWIFVKRSLENRGFFGRSFGGFLRKMARENPPQKNQTPKSTSRFREGVSLA